MAFTLKITNMAMLLFFCLVFIHESSDCVSGYGCFYAEAALNRKMLAGVEKYKQELKAALHTPVGALYRENMANWELRTVPSGPDPLHHNGNNPKKPRTP